MNGVAMVANEPRASIARGDACGNGLAALTTEVHVLFRLSLDLSLLYLAGQSALEQESGDTKLAGESQATDTASCVEPAGYRAVFTAVCFWFCLGDHAIMRKN